MYLPSTLAIGVHAIAGKLQTKALLFSTSIKKAPWTTACFSPQYWRANIAPRHVLFDRLSYLSQMSCENDELHILHLGVNQTLIGSAIWTLVYRSMHGDYHQNLEAFWTAMTDYYVEHDVEVCFTSFSGSAFHDPSRPRLDFPRLKGRGIEVKHSLWPVRHIFREHARPMDDDRLAMRALDAMCDIQDIFEQYSDEYFIPRPEAKRVLELCNNFLADYASLSTRASAAGDLLWPCIPKHHVFYHMCDRAQYSHPRLGNCCLDEDYVNRVKRIVVSDAAGSSLHRTPGKVLAKMLWGKSLLHRCGFA